MASSTYLHLLRLDFMLTFSPYFIYRLYWRYFPMLCSK